MNLVVALEHRFDGIPDGAVWTQGAFDYRFWLGYLEVFDSVRVVARVRPTHAPPPGWDRADGERVAFAAVPYYLGPWQYLLRSRQVKRAACSAVGPADAVIMRVGSQLAACLEPLLCATRHPYGLEVVGDPYDVFAPGTIRHPLRAFFHWWAPRQLRRQCLRACAISYVTAQAQRRRYPPAPGRFAFHISDAQLPPAAFVSTARVSRQDSRPYRLVTVGSLAQLYKATDVLIDAVEACVRTGLDLTLTVIGDGKYRAELESRAKACKLDGRVRFLGQLPAGAAVRAQLDQADLFVLPSKTEGLPRAMVEAMARAVPCIGSWVGGIPELLPPEDLVAPGDTAALAAKIREVITNPQRLASMSARNLEKAAEYREQVLYERRVAFYQQVRKTTEEWVRTGKIL